MSNYKNDHTKYKNDVEFHINKALKKIHVGSEDLTPDELYLAMINKKISNHPENPQYLIEKSRFLYWRILNMKYDVDEISAVYSEIFMLISQALLLDPSLQEYIVGLDFSSLLSLDIFEETT